LPAWLTDTPDKSSRKKVEVNFSLILFLFRIKSIFPDLGLVIDVLNSLQNHLHEKVFMTISLLNQDLRTRMK